MNSREPHDDDRDNVGGVDNVGDSGDSGDSGDLLGRGDVGGFGDLEAELFALGDALDVPAPPPADVAAAVRARLSATPASPVTRPLKRAHRRGRRWAVVAAVVLAVAALTAATPQGRAAVAQILRYAGIELRLGGAPTPTSPGAPTPTALPGERAVTLAQARALVRFPVRTPAALGAPDVVTVADGGRVVSMLWPGGLRLDQFDGTISPYLWKQLGPPFPEEVHAAGLDALWIGGAHPLGYIKREDGTSVPLRQAAPTLIWESGGVGHRLEGAGGKDRATRIAASLH
ncbi:hypothetical protein HTZ77_42580 [Nonomuraea sp. SMC257]|uniref:DUF4367 domain-containing protein n=1 Tax=Nonomuraea montanisoli TaxID=2741721 RepID=A0A7Y6IGY2_9ACTN|nr:hypothetical protein [Nonomuraea montanisoli]NUW38040.1 hypothetical protein [Nonomuraea montanisoli]